MHKSKAGVVAAGAIATVAALGSAASATPAATGPDRAPDSAVSTTQLRLDRAANQAVNTTPRHLRRTLAENLGTRRVEAGRAAPHAPGTGVHRANAADTDGGGMAPAYDYSDVSASGNLSNDGDAWAEIRDGGRGSADPLDGDSSGHGYSPRHAAGNPSGGLTSGAAIVNAPRTAATAMPGQRQSQPRTDTARPSPRTAKATGAGAGSGTASGKSAASDQMRKDNNGGRSGLGQDSFRDRLAALMASRAALPGYTGDRQQPLITLGVSSAVNAAAWQVCGSDAVAGIGGTGALSSPHTLVGDCANSNTLLQQDVQPGLISILDDTSVDVASWQVCGSHVVAGVGATVSQGSPSTVAGDCHNANSFIEAPDDQWGTRSLLSLLSGSTVDVLSWQVCGSSAVMGLGAVVASSSPTIVTGDCTNAGSGIEDRENNAIIPILSNVPLNLAPLQICETNSPASILGLVVPLNSPAFVGGSCYSPDYIPHGLFGDNKW